jgi:hypothetical protein
MTYVLEDVQLYNSSFAIISKYNISIWFLEDSRLDMHEDSTIYITTQAIKLQVILL